MKGKRVRPKDIQLRDYGSVRSQQPKVGRSRKLGRLSLLDKRVRNNGKRDLGLSKIEHIATMEDIYVLNDLPCSLYDRAYKD